MSREITLQEFRLLASIKSYIAVNDVLESLENNGYDAYLVDRVIFC
jgi:hypothetical protein